MIIDIFVTLKAHIAQQEKEKIPTRDSIRNKFINMESIAYGIFNDSLFLPVRLLMAGRYPHISKNQTIIL